MSPTDLAEIPQKFSEHRVEAASMQMLMALLAVGHYAQAQAKEGRPLPENVTKSVNNAISAATGENHGR